MRLEHKKISTKQSRRWLGFLLIAVVTILVVVPVTLSAQAAPSPSAANAHSKLAADLANFPLNADGTVSVIVQFKQTPKAHASEMAAQGGHLKFSFDHINGAAYRIPVRMLAWLENHPDVVYVSPDRPNKVASDDDISAVEGDVARQQYGLDGTGIGVAIIDSGVFNHDDLQKSSGLGSRIVYSESFIPGDPSTNDAYGHGTHVAGIVAGNGHDSASGYPAQYIGVAPNADIINLRVLNANGSGTDSQVIAAIQRAIQLKSTYNIRVINLSLGRGIYESYDLDPVCQAVEAAWKAGIVVVVAAGNEGRDNDYGTQGYATIQAPANDPNVITVGATKTNGTPSRQDDTIASYSSKGPTLLDHLVKPDLVAPGNRIVSLASPGSTLVTSLLNLNIQPITTCLLGLLGNNCTTGLSGKYTRMSGTSMATPIVAGAAALMFQKDPTLTPDTIKARMMKTAWKGYPGNSWAYDSWGKSYFSQYDVFTIGAGYLDIYSSLKSNDVVNGGAPSPVAYRNTATGKYSVTNSQSITWGNSITWGSSIIWGDSIVWGGNAVLCDSIIWGDSIVWGDTSLSANSIIWSNSIVWSPDTINALSDGEDGEN
ncbi:MAG TPA: S8 family serine peptidase [Candidatus Acidoferrales bacterium]|nr:S8 family serine peptidase [Candidatus Acidoferrales bacterium]